MNMIELVKSFFLPNSIKNLMNNLKVKNKNKVKASSIQIRMDKNSFQRSNRVIIGRKTISKKI